MSQNQLTRQQYRVLEDYVQSHRVRLSTVAQKSPNVVAEAASDACGFRVSRIQLQTACKTMSVKIMYAKPSTSPLCNLMQKTAENARRIQMIESALSRMLPGFAENMSIANN